MLKLQSPGSDEEVRGEQTEERREVEVVEICERFLKTRLATKTFL
jgi:hypothetical protein